MEKDVTEPIKSSIRVVMEQHSIFLIATELIVDYSVRKVSVANCIIRAMSNVIELDDLNLIVLMTEHVESGQRDPVLLVFPMRERNFI